MKLIAEDMSNLEIADELFITLSTVKTHIYNIYTKLGVPNRVKAIERARELSLLS